jgi:histidinol-phosphate aminotransferase
MSGASGLLGRESYARISLYAPDRRPCAIDLSDNTNLWGAPPNAARALRDAASASMTRYPELYAGALKGALANYMGVGADQVVTGCGSDDVLDSAIRAFAEPGDRVAVPDPSFAMIPIFARMNSLEPVLVPLTSDYHVDVDRTLRAEARITYLCSPNNPTGTSLSRGSIEQIIAGASGLVIVDEAYAEFAGCSVTDLLERSDRLLITRTMSKAFGLAGLRVGYAIGAPNLIREVEKSRGPYKVNGIAEHAALSALRDDIAWVRANVEAAIANRARLTDSLRDLGVDALPSSANFVLAPVPNAGRIAHELRIRGIAVRPFEGLACAPGTSLAATGGDALRITVGPWELLAPALDALREVLPCFA